MSKRGKNIQVVFNLSNRVLYTFIAIFLLLIVGVGVYASSHGVSHSLDEIPIPSSCPDNQILKWSGGVWNCGSDSDTQNLATSGNTGDNRKFTLTNGGEVLCKTITGSAGLCDGSDAVGGHGDGSNCDSGEYAVGVDANGNSQCTSAPVFAKAERSASFPSCNEGSLGDIIVVPYVDKNSGAFWMDTDALYICMKLKATHITSYSYFWYSIKITQTSQS